MLATNNPWKPWVDMNMQAFQQFQKLCLTALPANNSQPEKKRA
jgi:hypothetical protein